MSTGHVLDPRDLGFVLSSAFQFRVPYGPFILGLRGAEERGGKTYSVPVDHVRMRCRLLIMSWNGQKKVGPHLNVKGTTAPGRHWLLNPMNKGGTAMIAPGFYQAHQRGLHKGFPAFRQIKKLVCWRDSSRDAKLNVKDSFDEAGPECGINIHYGSTSAQLIGTLSAGCVVFSLAHYDRTYRAILNLFHPTQVVPLFIIPFELIERAINDNQFRCLLIGSEGSLVRKVQQKLGVAVDGDYGINTARALIVKQQALGIRADGICGPQTLKALGM